jgi:hypothetical protein
VSLPRWWTYAEREALRRLIDARKREALGNVHAKEFVRGSLARRGHSAEHLLSLRGRPDISDAEVIAALDFARTHARREGRLPAAGTGGDTEVTELPPLDAHLLDGCRTIADATARLAGLLIESGLLADVADDHSRLAEWIEAQARRLPDDTAALLAAVSVRARPLPPS